MYKATKQFSTGGRLFSEGERVSGLKESEMRELEAKGLIEVEKVQVKPKPKKKRASGPKQNKSITPNKEDK